MTLEVDGDLRALILDVQRLNPANLTARINEQWAEAGVERLREFVGGGPVTNYLTARSGGTRESVQKHWTATQASISASGPGMEYQEEGGVILPRNGEYLTFRLYNAWDGAEATGEWIRTRRVTIKAKHPVRDAALQALDLLGNFADSFLEAT